PMENKVRVNLGSGEGSALPEQLKVRFLHTTRAGYDKNIVLKHLGGGSYIGALDGALQRGSWRVQLEQTDWRIIGRMLIPQQPFASLEAASQR
ncbi:MAG: FixH family protein, partial [Gammaproteobacteria bacterium]